MGKARISILPGDRSNIDDTSAAVLLEQRYRRSTTKEDPLSIDIHDAVPFRLGQFFRLLNAYDPSRMNGNVQLAKTGHDTVTHIGNRIRPPDVNHQCLGQLTKTANFVSNFLCGLQIDIRHENRGPFLRQSKCDAATNAVTSTRYVGRLSSETHHRSAQAKSALAK